MADNQDTVNRLIKAFNRHDAFAVAGYFTIDATVHDPHLPQPLKGPTAIRENLQAWLKAFPDAQFEVSSLNVSGDNATVNVVFKGTHRGPLQGPQGAIAPTGKQVAVNGSMTHKFNAQGQIVEERRQYKMEEMLKQLGVSAAA
jgi:steroid delta-isomerase-like uncharacterized protein